MGNVIRVRCAGWAASSLEIHAEESWMDDAPEIEAVCAAFRLGGKKALVFNLAEADIVIDGLTMLAFDGLSVMTRRRTYPNAQIRRQYRRSDYRIRRSKRRPDRVLAVDEGPREIRIRGRYVAIKEVGRT